MKSNWGILNWLLWGAALFLIITVMMYILDPEQEPSCIKGENIVLQDGNYCGSYCADTITLINVTNKDCDLELKATHINIKDSTLRI